MRHRPRCLAAAPAMACPSAFLAFSLELCVAFLMLLVFRTSSLLADEPDVAATPSASSTAPNSTAPDSVSVTGELTIEGVEPDTVERLALDLITVASGSSGKSLVLERPGTSVAVPVGRYYLGVIRLRDGYYCWCREELIVSADKPCSIKIGSLRQQLPVLRHWQVIELSYRLVDAEGRRYIYDHAPPPFTVYCNGRVVGSDSFIHGKGMCRCLWSVPATGILGPLTFVASADLNGLGPKEAEPTVVDWQWCDNWPIFCGWVFVVALLVFMNDDLDPRAWMVLIPIFLLIGFILSGVLLQVLLSGFLQQWIEYYAFESSYLDGVQWQVAVWVTIWAMSPWLERRRPVTAFLIPLGLAMLIIVVAEFCVSGRLSFVTFLIGGASVGCLLVAFVLAARSCHTKYGPWYFMAWLLLWLVVAVAVVGIVVGTAFGVVAMFSGASLATLLTGVPASLTMILNTSACFAAILYLLNLPFLVLAFRCRLYHERLRKILRLPETAALQSP